MTNGVEVLKVEDGEQLEVTQPRVTKAQKRRVRRSNTEDGRRSNSGYFIFLNGAPTKEMFSLYFITQDKKAAQEKERETRIAEAEVQNLQGARHQEGIALAQKLAQKQLQIKEISSDGHCMYRAIADQLAQRSKVSVPSGRPPSQVFPFLHPPSPLFDCSPIQPRA